MDISKKYILMCEKAEEIQKGWKFDDGDFMVAPSGEIWIVCDYYSAACYNKKEKRQDHPQAHKLYFNAYSDTFRNFDGGYEWEDELIAKRKDCIWLPRQDQLQEMLSYTIQAELLNAFYTFAFRDSWCGKLDSMEQLWLAFVIKEKYNKGWNEKEWGGLTVHQK